MNNNILLSICIPTYNRHDCLIQCLDSIVNQDGFDQVSIEIAISDNFSQDDTEVLIKGYQSKYSNVIYMKNTQNLGFDRNLDNSISMANGKYCLLISDDDGLIEGSLINILNLISQDNCSYYLSNSISFDVNFKNRISLNTNLSYGNEVYRYDSLRNFMINKKQLAMTTVGYFGGMSGQIFLREKWINYVDRIKYFGTQVIHLHTLLHVMKNEKFAIIGMPIIKARADNLRWDSFGMSSALKRELMTMNTFRWITKEFNIKYSLFLLYLLFIFSYTKNSLIGLIKKYMIRDQEQLFKIKHFFTNFYIKKHE